MPADISAASSHISGAYGSEPSSVSISTSSLKVLMDKLGALTALVLLSPVLGAVALTLYLTQKGPIFFSHTRVGKDGREFGCLKFRTMVPEAAEMLAEILDSDPIARQEWEENFKFENDPRVTRVGAILRKTSLDELPQIWNVLRGDMSLVGPRPITHAEGEMYGIHYSEYKSVRPGLTGLWQVSGRSDTTYDERVALDVDYVRNLSFFSDLRILFATVSIVLRRTGAH